MTSDGVIALVVAGVALALIFWLQLRAVRSQRALEHLFEAAPEAMVALDDRGRLDRVNRRAREIFGYDHAELAQRPAEQLIPEGLASAGQLSGRRKDGTVFPIDVSLTPAGSQRLTLVLIRDITERVRSEESLREAEDRVRAGQRMEAMGLLAGGVAHDVNNMMTVVTGYSEALIDQVATPEGRKALLEIRKATERCVGLTTHLLAFSRRQVLTPTVLDLNRIVSDLCPLLPMLLGEEIRVATRRAPDVGHVRADAAQLEQVIVNLVANARDAMRHGGLLIIETRNVEFRHHLSLEADEVVPGRYVMLAITDSGHGMDDATMARVFEPFFTTKPAGQGTGLGLSTAYGIVKQSGGYVAVESTPGTGSTFRVYLPLVTDPLTPVIEDVPEGDIQGGGETVLLVEDEQALCRVLEDVLGKGGYRVLAAHNASDALVLAATHAGPIDLIVADVILPGMDGVTLANEILELRPHVRLLFMSGYSHEAVDAALRHAKGQFLRKPFAPPVFLAKVREALDAGR